MIPSMVLLIVSVVVLVIAYALVKFIAWCDRPELAFMEARRIRLLGSLQECANLRAERELEPASLTDSRRKVRFFRRLRRAYGDRDFEPLIRRHEARVAMFERDGFREMPDWYDWLVERVAEHNRDCEAFDKRTRERLTLPTNVAPDYEVVNAWSFPDSEYEFEERALDSNPPSSLGLEDFECEADVSQTRGSV